jgi:hypothetical protein
MTCKNSSNYLTDNSSCSGKSWFAFFYGLGLACGLIVSSWWLAQKLLTPTAVSASPLTGADSVPLNALHMSGSWGRLRVETIYTEKPAHFIDVAPYLKSEEKWFFEEMDIAEIREWLTINGFDKDFVEELVIAEPKPDVKGVYLHPTQKLIIQLDPQERKKIHNLLAKNSINHFSENPFLFTPDVIQQIRSNPIMQEEGSGAIFEKLLYPRGTAMCLSDISCLLSNVKNPSLCAAWLKLLTRTKTILLKLEIEESSDIDSLVNYWSGPFNLKDFQPLLESIKVDNKTSRLDVIHLLPPVARQIIYTYPIEDGAGEYRDCHWTVINFFEESKNDQFLVI